MAPNDYHFVTVWRVLAGAEAVYDLLSVPEDLPLWWPAVYLEVTTLEPGAPGGVGRLVELYTKGWLPYTLRWRFRVTDARRPHGFSIEALGDFVGRGEWSFTPAAGALDVRYDWRVRAEKPLLRALSFVLKPVFAANHRWAMARGEESLRLELARRAARTEAERAAVPPPPAPTFRRR